MINWLSVIYNRIYFRIRPPELIEGQYWWVKNVHGDVMRVLIKRLDGDIVVVKNMTDYRFTTSSSTTETTCFVNYIRWIKSVEAAPDE